VTRTAEHAALERDFEQRIAALVARQTAHLEGAIGDLQRMLRDLEQELDRRAAWLHAIAIAENYNARELAVIAMSPGTGWPNQVWRAQQ
jgi:hypothetical protein